MYRNSRKIQPDYYDPKYSKPVKKKRSYEEFGTYCSKLMKNSLITGFPVMAASKSSLRRGVKMLVFLICTAGFIYQTYYFLEMYLAFPTILDISVVYPEAVSAPALTICNRNRLLRQPFCEEFRSTCSWKYKTYEDLCYIYPKYCPRRMPSNFVLGIVEMRDIVNLNRSNEVLNAVGPRDVKDLITGCVVKGIGKPTPCKDMTSIIAAKDGKPYKCFSIMSLIGKPDEDPSNLALTDEYNMMISMHPEEYMNHNELIQAYVYIHDPRSVTNPTAEGVTLKVGHTYKLYVTMEKRESLPPPYKSNCTDYLTTWKKNGGYGPISKRGCTELCKIEAMVKEFGCVGQTITYPNNFTICDKPTIVTTEEMNKRCSQNCNDGCDSSLYSITTEVIEDIAEILCTEDDLHCKNNLLAVKVSFSRMTITKYKHEPKFQSVEMFSYIGGYMGMWLGISLVSLFDFVEMMFDVLAYPVLKWRTNNIKNNIRMKNMQRAPPMFNMYDI